MATTKSIQEHLDILEGTKNSIRSALQQKGVLVQDEDTFRSYSDKVLQVQSGVASSEVMLNIDGGGSLVVKIPNDTKCSYFENMLRVHKGTIITVPYGTEEPKLAVGDYLETENFVIVDFTYANGKLFYYVEVQNDMDYEGVVIQEEDISVTDLDQGNGFITKITPLTHEQAKAQGYLLVYDYDSMRNTISQNMGGKIMLANDIDCTGKTWSPLNRFTGVLDGNGHTIKNLSVSYNSQYTGMFRYAQGATIRNIRFLNGKSTWTSGHDGHGFLIGCTDNSSARVNIINCIFDGCALHKNNTSGGVYYIAVAVGNTATNSLTITNCRFMRNSFKNNGSTVYYIGNAVGYKNSGCNIYGCIAGNMTRTGGTLYYYGDLMGYHYWGSVCYNSVQSLYQGITGNSNTMTGNQITTITDYWISVYDSAGTLVRRLFYTASTPLVSIYNTLISSYGYKDEVDEYGVHHIISTKGYYTVGTLPSTVEDVKKFYGSVDLKGCKVVLRNNTYIGTGDNPAIQNTIHYNSTKNTISTSLNTNAVEDKVLSMPVLVAETDTNFNIIKMPETYNGIGYYYNKVYCDRGTVVLIPDGKDEYDNAKFITYCVPDFILENADTASTVDTTFIKYLDKTSMTLNDGIYGGAVKILINHLHYQEVEPTKIGRQLWYKPSDNLYYGIEASTDEWQVVYPAIFANRVTCKDSKVYSIEKNLGLGLITQYIQK
jgi:hypothetical protein